MRFFKIMSACVTVLAILTATGPAFAEPGPAAPGHTSAGNYACVYHGDYANGGYETVQLSPGSSLSYSAYANDRGESNTWGAYGC